MKSKAAYFFAKRVWRSTHEYLPDPVQRFLIRHHEKLVQPPPSRAPSEADDEGESALTGNISKSRPSDRHSDGMPDYPATRPRLTLEYLQGLVTWLATSDYAVMSYHDLNGPLQIGDEQQEFSRWIARAESRGEKAILLQYDVDARPDVTARLLDVHIEHGVRANVMIFVLKIFDWKLKREGIVEYDETYQLDFAKLEAFQKIGGVVGYHCNAFDRAAGDDALALEIFHRDVVELRKHLDVCFFSMHGGHVTADGRCNATMPVASYLNRLGLAWVHNGHSANFHATWSDGSASNPRYRREASDPLDFILSTNAGQRARLLFHPQYYNDSDNARFDFPVLQDQAWVSRTRNSVKEGNFDGCRYWRSRYRTARRSIEQFDELFRQLPREAPIFVSGLSRSGTTLLVSMFDAHPNGAMAYESYPRYLHVPSDDGVLTVEEYIYCYQCLMNYPDNVAFALLDRKPLRNLRTFAAVSSWTGMTTAETGELLRAYLTKHHRILGPRQALEVVAASVRFKVRAEDAAFWGTKCQGNFDDYVALWPKARLIYILRNGLDILASQQTSGAFNPNPKNLGRRWRDSHRNFQTFQSRNPQLHSALVRYEDLVRSPEETMQRVCDEIGLNYHPQMVRQHEMESTLMKSPRGQLSVDRVSQPIDETSVDRWKAQLSDADVSDFIKGCGGTELFKIFGYGWKR